MARPKVNKEDNEKKPKENKSGGLLSRLKKASGSTCASILSDDEYPIRDWISTGNYMLNCLISADPFKGIPSGRSIQLAGQKGVGKTFIAIEIMKNAQKAYGYDGVIWDSEFANNDKKGMEDRGLDSSKILWCGVETIEGMKTETLNTIEEIEPSEKVIMMIDSLGNLPSRKELEDGYSGSDKKDMTRASALKSFFRSITMPVGFKNIPLIAINHVYAQVGSFIPMDVVAGGGGPAYGVSITVLIAKSQLKDGDEVVGAKLRCKTDKNRFAKEKAEVVFTIDFEGGLNLYSGLLDFCYDEEIMKPLSAVPKSGDIRKIKGWEYKGVEYKRSEITPEFWEKALADDLGDILRNKFKYQSAVEGLELDDDIDEEEND